MVSQGLPYCAFSEFQKLELSEDHPTCQDPQNYQWLRDPDTVDQESKTELKKIENFQEWISGKTVTHVDTHAHYLTFTFRTGPKLRIDMEIKGCYEITQQVVYE